MGVAKGKSGASHRLCWAHDPPEFEGDGSAVTDFGPHYRVEIDPDFMWVRFTAVVDCVRDRPCVITIYGVGMGPTNQILLIKSSGQRSGPAGGGQLRESVLEVPRLRVRLAIGGYRPAGCALHSADALFCSAILVITILP